MTLRPPRVVIVIDGGEQWSFWARRALFRAGRVWGGAGLAVVPHHDGEVHPVLLRACQAYDPDYVVTYPPTVGDLEFFDPGWFQITSADGDCVTGEERLRLLEQASAEVVPVQTDAAARDQIAAECSTYQTSEHGELHEAIEILGENDVQHFPTVLNMQSTWHGSVLACPSDWGGALGAAVACYAGVAAPPARDASEPEITGEVRKDIASWLLGNAGATPPNELLWHPTSALGIDTAAATTANDRTMTHLLPITAGFPHRQTGLLVLGDTAEDFALSRLWRLTFGTAHWLPSVLGVSEEHVPWPIERGVTRIARRLNEHAGKLAITSMSLSHTELTEARAHLRAARPVTNPAPARNTDLDVLTSQNLPWKQSATVSLAVNDQWDSIVTIPVTVDDMATTRMAAPLPPPILTHPELAAQSDTNWHVDVQWRPGQAVRRRGLDSLALFADRPTMMQTWARSSRDGVTYQAQRYDLVVAGTRNENRLARVALRDLSLQAWVAAKGTEHGLQVRVSDAGRRATLLADMLGGRQSYTELFGGVLLPALRAMLPKSASTTAAYPDRQGIALSAGEGVLSFAGICARTPNLPKDEVRRRIDAASRAGVIRRGLVLRCATCEHKQFQTIDNISQRWTCQRCDALSDLDQWSWKAPNDEPIWFYDLHPVGRQVLRDNGHVPALLSTYLRNKQNPRNTFDDVAEVEFVKDGQPEVELDLVTYTDDTITVAECKSSGNDLVGRSGRAEITKKCTAASRIRADQLVFATTAERWTSASRSTIETTTQNYSSWRPAGAPKVVLIAGLGTDDVSAEVSGSN
ncbi:hypothetical protein CLV71_11744 [Actinophytocola oryzae]|uniref:Uncharacterized protein n=2 Tax=Actinophytocola oryzae TaxID=502181 RepID=A0A4R7V3U5_9PSEU|nr:hypothetical protein CLV71_11744 [Actinophytocola oryzae]